MPPDRPPTEAFADYLLEVGALLIAYGCPSYRLEEVVQTVARVAGHEAEAFAVPTALFVSLPGAPGGGPVLRMARVRAWGVDLDRLTEVDQIFNRVARGGLSLDDARRELRALGGRPRPYPRALQHAATASVSGAVALVFGGGAAEVVAAAASGALVGLLVLAFGRAPGGGFLGDFAGGLGAALCAWLGRSLLPPLRADVVIPSAVIALVPGLTLATGLVELTRKNLVAGSARLMEALASLLLLAIGIGLVSASVPALWPSEPAPAPAAFAGLGAQALALAAATLSYAVLVSVPPRYLPAALSTSAAGWLVGLALGPGAAPHLAAFAASLAVSTASNALARAFDRPALLFQLPGLILLVPGSYGLRSAHALAAGAYAGGAAKGVETALLAGSIVAGVLLANVLLPSRKLL
ncbi:MAG TPA: threonine/serine exporter family protein [Polyangiaceae bacterium]|nr:threonine/serine exporter family protein [Polyangiaceae bacterium]